MHELSIHPIAYIENAYDEKFGIPRQSGLVSNTSIIRFAPEYRDVNAVRGLEGFNYLWLIWSFSENVLKNGEKFHPTVRPPRLGGNTRMGVFATRSSFRPNNLALSSVRLVNIDLTSEDAPLLTVEGADLMNGTPIYDIKPYLLTSDFHPDANGGFTEAYADGEYRLEVEIPEEVKEKVRSTFAKQEPNSGITDVDRFFEELTEVLAEDPRPSYQSDPERIYGMLYDGQNVKFCVEGKLLTVVDIEVISRFNYL